MRTSLSPNQVFANNELHSPGDSNSRGHQLDQDCDPSLTWQPLRCAESLAACASLLFVWAPFLIWTSLGVAPGQACAANPASRLVCPVDWEPVLGSEEQEAADQGRVRPAVALRVDLPINGRVSADLITSLKRIAEKFRTVVDANDRPIVVLEFDTARGKTGRGSELEACLALARYLGSPELNRLQTIAYVRSMREQLGLPAADQPLAQLNGHAVLVAVAANQLVVEKGAAIGRAGIDETTADPLVFEIYRSIASQRLRQLPEPVVMRMLDANRQLFKVETAGRGTLFVGGEAQTKLELSGEALKSDEIGKRNEMLLLTGNELEKLSLAKFSPASKTDLERQLGLADNALRIGLASGKERLAVEFAMPPVIDSQTVRWLLGKLDQEIGQGKVNLVILDFDNNQGNFDACLRLSQRLAKLDPDQVTTVAFVKGSISGAVAMLALTCDDLIIAPEARLGGQPELATDPLPQDELETIKPLVQELAKQKQTDWSLMMSMLDPAMIVTRYRQLDNGWQKRLLGNEELESLEDLARWQPEGTIGGTSGIGAVEAEEYGIARLVADDAGQVQSFYQLEATPVPLLPSASDRLVDRLARFLAKPIVSAMLLFGAMFLFSTEMSAPGLGVPGFLGAVCIALFFWSQTLDGNADWLEVIMFVLGVIFLGIELFVVPGFGIFGVGGLFMIVSAIALASQDFLIPRTPEQMAQIPYSLLPVVGAGCGMVAGLYAIRKMLPHSPYLKRILLQPRERVETGLGEADPEAVVDWSFLANEQGVTVTKLYPAGKAKIRGRVYDVISSGQMLDKGTRIVVVEARGNRIVVQPISP